MGTGDENVVIGFIGTLFELWSDQYGKNDRK